MEELPNNDILRLLNADPLAFNSLLESCALPTILKIRLASKTHKETIDRLFATLTSKQFIDLLCTTTHIYAAKFSDYYRSLANGRNYSDLEKKVLGNDETGKPSDWDIILYALTTDDINKLKGKLTKKIIDDVLNDEQHRGLKQTCEVILGYLENRLSDLHKILSFSNYSNRRQPIYVHSITKPILCLNLQGANFQDANLEDVNLKNADLAGANLAGANLYRADFPDAKLQGANLRGAHLFRAHFECANLQDACLQGADFERARLERTNLQDANLEGANLIDTNLIRANFQGANLRGADLRGADLFRAQFQGANLQDARLQGTNLKDAIFINIKDNTHHLKKALENLTINIIAHLSQTQFEEIRHAIVENFKAYIKEANDPEILNNIIEAIREAKFFTQHDSTLRAITSRFFTYLTNAQRTIIEAAQARILELRAADQTINPESFQPRKVR